jgi:hypothetical protein
MIRVTRVSNDSESTEGYLGVDYPNSDSWSLNTSTGFLTILSIATITIPSITLAIWNKGSWSRVERIKDDPI